MSILMPEGVEWLTSSWISRGFFDDAMTLQNIDLRIRNDIRFCLDAEVDTLDLSDVNIIVMKNFSDLVKEVITYRLARKGNDFYLPEYFSLYMSKLEELKNLTHEVLSRMTLSTRE